MTSTVLIYRGSPIVFQLANAEKQDVVTNGGHLAKNGQSVTWLHDDAAAETTHA